MSEIAELKNIYLQVASSSGDGMNVEICGDSNDPRFPPGSLNPTFWFRADEEGSIKFVTCTEHGMVSVPLESLEEAILLAKREVHCESFYDDP